MSFNRRTAFLRRCLTLSKKTSFSLPLDILSRRFLRQSTGDYKVVKSDQEGQTWDEIKTSAAISNNATRVRRNWYLKCLMGSSVLPSIFFSKGNRDIFVPKFRIDHRKLRIHFTPMRKVPLKMLENALFRRYIFSRDDDYNVGKYVPFVYRDINDDITILTMDESIEVGSLEDGDEKTVGEHTFVRQGVNCIVDGGVNLFNANVTPVNSISVPSQGPGMPPFPQQFLLPNILHAFYYYDAKNQPNMLTELDQAEYPNVVNESGEYIFEGYPVCFVGIQQIVY